MYRYFKDSLSNGLRVVTVEIPHLHTALVAAYVRCGSRHERVETNGVSHFLEHMFFRGSERFPDTVAMNAAVEDAGGNLNGCTARDHSFYYTPIHPAHLAIALDTLGDMIQRPLFREIEVEREIILEEMLDEVDVHGRDVDIDNLSKRAVFGPHPLSLKIAGTPDTVRALSLDQIRAHHERFYNAANLVVSVAGPVQREEVLRLAEAAFGKVKPGSPSSESAPPPPPPGPGFLFVDHEESQTEFRLSFPCPPENHPDYPALMIARRVLDDGLSSWLPFRVVEKKGLAYSLHAGIDQFSDCGLFEVEGAAAHAKVPQVIEEIGLTLAELCEKPIPEREFSRAKRRHRIGLEFALDSVGELSGWFGGTELFRPPISFEERCTELESMTPERVREVCARIFSRSNLVACAVGPKKGGSEAKIRAAVERSKRW